MPMVPKYMGKQRDGVVVLFLTRKVLGLVIPNGMHCGIVMLESLAHSVETLHCREMHALISQYNSTIN